MRRSYRFGQTQEVNVWMITTDRMINVIKSIHDKEKSFKKMQKEMTLCIVKHLNNEIMTINDFLLNTLHPLPKPCNQSDRVINFL
jgi:hypothetical protein